MDFDLTVPSVTITWVALWFGKDGEWTTATHCQSREDARSEAENGAQGVGRMYECWDPEELASFGFVSEHERWDSWTRDDGYGESLSSEVRHYIGECEPWAVNAPR